MLASAPILLGKNKRKDIHFEEVGWNCRTFPFDTSLVSHFLILRCERYPGRGGPRELQSISLRVGAAYFRYRLTMSMSSSAACACSEVGLDLGSMT